MKAEDFGNLEASLMLCIGARVMLTDNLWQEVGLCNGSIGYVVDIIYLPGQKPTDLPSFVLVQFDSYEGPVYCKADGTQMPKVVPIPCVTHQFKDATKGGSGGHSQNYLTRTQ